MGYEYADYEAQIKQIAANNKKRKRSAGARRIHKHQKLNPVITGVLYYGDKAWKHPLCLHDMLQFPDGLEEVLRAYVADYPMNLIQVARLTEEERGRLTSDFRIVAEYLACKDDKEKWTDFLKGSKEIIHVEELLDVIAEISKDEHYLVLRDKIRKENRRKEKWDMCKIAEELERVGIEKGRAEGLAEGREEGREEGILAMIQDNLEMGLEKEKILEKTMRFFSVTWENALKYYSQVATE